MITCNTNECNIRTFYEGSQSIDPLLIKQYQFNGMEIFALIKSLNLTQPLLTSFCKNSDVKCNDINNCTDNCGPEQVLPNKLIIDANQMLAIGYSHLNIGFPLVLSVFPDVEIVVRNGGKIVIFNDNSFINYGNLFVDNSCVILESPGVHRARFINNGCITFKQSFLLGQGIILNNGTLNIICYSKVRIGKCKSSENNVEEINTSSKQTNQDGLQKALSCLDFVESMSRIINAGTLSVNSYSTLELEGSLINGKSEITNCFFDQLCVLLPNETSIISCPSNASFQVSGNSKFSFTFSDNSDSEFINDINSCFCFKSNTSSTIMILPDSRSKNTIVNKGNFILNGECTFKSCNLDNYSTIESTFSVDSDAGNVFNYSKILFTTDIDPPKICNISKQSSIRIAPTTTLFIDGYNVINYGTFLIGQNLNSSISNRECRTPLEACARKCFSAEDLSLSASFFYGFINVNTNNSDIVFKNFNQICIGPKSIFMLGKNSLLNNLGKPQTNMLNQGQIFNFGLLQVNRASEIINRPCPFNVSNEEFSIYNAGFSGFNSNSVILIRKPDNGNSTGGFIKSVSAYGYNGGKINNNSLGIIITWVGYQQTENNGVVDCQLIYGLQSGISGSGKIRFIAYPNIASWDQACLQQYLQAQANNTGIEYAF